MLTDRNGVAQLRIRSHVKITHPRHSYHGQTGTVVRIRDRRVWVALPDGTVVPAGNRSLQVL